MACEVHLQIPSAEPPIPPLVPSLRLWARPYYIYFRPPACLTLCNFIFCPGLASLLFLASAGSRLLDQG